MYEWVGVPVRKSAIEIGYTTQAIWIIVMWWLIFANQICPPTAQVNFRAWIMLLLNRIHWKFIKYPLPDYVNIGQIYGPPRIKKTSYGYAMKVVSVNSTSLYEYD